MKGFLRHFWLESVSREKLPGNAMSLATLLYLKANKEGITWVSNDVISIHFHWSKFTLSRARNILFAKGLIKGPKSPTKSDPLRLVLVAEKRNQPVGKSAIGQLRKTATTMMSQLRIRATPVAEKRNSCCGIAQLLYIRKNHPRTIQEPSITPAAQNRLQKKSLMRLPKTLQMAVVFPGTQWIRFLGSSTASV